MKIEAKWEHNYKGDCLPNFSPNMSLPRHGWYGFKEGFSNTLVERAIKDTNVVLGKEKITVLDPFSGSGTTVLTALQNNCNSVAIEVNPFMSFVGKTKCSKALNDKNFYLSELKRLMDKKPIEKSSKLENYSTFTPNGDNKKWLFNTSVIRGFESLYSNIMNLESKDFFLLALYSSVMEFCNAKKDGKCLRYRKNWENLNYSATHVRDLFHKKCMEIIDDLDACPLTEGERTFYDGDARKAFEQLENNSIDLIVFSPPYLNTFDYSDIYRPELFLGKFVTTNDDLRLIRKETLRSHVQHKWDVCEEVESQWVNNVVSEVVENSADIWNKEIPNMINCYFYDMEQIMKEAYRVAVKGAQLWFVVGTSAYSGVEVPVDLMLADIASKCGWDLNSVNALRKLRTSSQCSNDEIRKIRLRESLVICEK